MDRKELYRLLEKPKSGDVVAFWVRIAMQTLIFFNVLAVILVTVDEIRIGNEHLFWLFEIFSVTLFTAEYLLRLWASAEGKGGRLRWVVSPMALIDLFAILPFYVSFMLMDFRILRIIRMLRLFRLFKLVRYSKALSLIGAVIRRKRTELVSTQTVFLIFVVLVSSVMYCLEHTANPAFPHIPAAIWWGIVTMTTVGYGDVVPITTLGRMLACFASLGGIALFATFAGVIVTGFSTEVKLRRRLAKARQSK